MGFRPIIGGDIYAEDIPPFCEGEGQRSGVVSLIVSLGGNVLVTRRS